MRKYFRLDIEKIPADTALPASLPRLYWHFMRQAKVLLAAVMLGSALDAGLSTLLPWYIGRIVDAMIHDGGTTHFHAGQMELIFILLCVATGLASTLNGYQQFVLYLPRFGNLIIRQVHSIALRHSIGFFQSDFAGRIASQVQQLGSAVSESMLKFVGTLTYVAIFIGSTAAILAHADWRLVVPLATGVVAHAMNLAYFIPRLQNRAEKFSDASNTLSGRIIDIYTNIVTVKLFSRRQNEDRFALDALQNVTHFNIAKNKQFLCILSILNLIAAVMTAWIMAEAIHLWSLHAITAGQLTMIVPLIIQIWSQFHWIMWEMTFLSENIGKIRNSIKTLAVPHTVTDAAAAVPLRVERGAIDFDHITFHYGRADGGIIEDLSLHIEPGQKIGLIGRSGAGKSTLTNLLLRFYDLESGRILIDGQDIAAVTQDSLRQAIAMVTQDTSLLHRSIRDNIIYGRPDAAEEQIIAAARRAHAHDFIPALADEEGRTGYDAHVGERGVKLSGGQRQRIALARIILKDAPILILDEATSALDSEVENYIQEHLNILMEGKTVIAIAHRLSTIARMDRLIVLDRGRIVEDGTHEVLLRQSGIYAQLWEHQSGGFLAD